MEIHQYLNNVADLYDNFILFINEEQNDDNNSFINYLATQKISNNKEYLTYFLYYISKISKNHNRNQFLLNKIEFIISHFEKDIKRTYSNYEIYNFFKKNKRILLFLFNKKIIIPDKTIINILIQQRKGNFRYYFYPEIKNFIKDEILLKKIETELIQINPNIFDQFDEKRIIGENDFHICSLIRNDLVEDFIIYVNQFNISLSSKIKSSIFETNSFLIDKKPTLIEYSAFFGSIQIFQYLILNNVQLTPSLWIYTIHSNNADMIHKLEELHIDISYEECFIESLKCHHNEIACYIHDIYLFNTNSKNFNEYIFHYHNYYNLPMNENNEFIYYLFKFKYYKIIENLIDKKILKPTSIIKMNNINSCTALQFAANLNLYEIVNLLLFDLKILYSHAFYQCEKLKKIDIISSVTEIENNAFNGCSSLYDVKIPSSIKKIKSNAFKNCVSLIHLSLPSDLISIENSAFEGCTKLKQINIPSSLKTIESNTFKNCISLTYVIIPSSITKICWSAFSFCTSLTKIDIPSSVTSIEGFAFAGCKSLEEVTISSSIASIEFKTFFECSSLSHISLPPSVTSIKCCSFCKCSSLREINIPSSVSTIESYAFSGCSSLMTLSIPLSVTSIGDKAFAGCFLLKQISIPEYLYSKAIGLPDNIKIIKKSNCTIF